MKRSHSYSPDIPNQIIRSELLRHELDDKNHYRNLWRSNTQNALKAATAQTPSTNSHRTRDNIELARDIGWALKPDIDNIAAHPKVVQSAAHARIIKENIPPRVAISVISGAEQRVKDGAIIFNADFERNYENALTIVDAGQRAGEVALGGVVSESTPPHDGPEVIALESQAA